MARLWVGHSEQVGEWVAARAPLQRPDWGNFVGLGILGSDGKLVAGVVFSDWQPAFRRIEFSAAADHRRAFSPQIRREIGDYVFGQLNVYRVWARTSVDNRRARIFLRAIGFRPESTEASWYGPGVHAIQYRIFEPEWRQRWPTLQKAA